MANVRLLYNMDDWDGASVTESSQASTDLQAENVLHDHIAKLWRTTRKASEWIRFELGSANQI